jgi:ATP-binding cassette, sub-family E, member 1
VTPRSFILHAKKTAFIVEHDFIMATYLADRVIVYEGAPGVDCVANSCALWRWWRGGIVTAWDDDAFLMALDGCSACHLFGFWLDFDGRRRSWLRRPQPLLSGMNKFLKQLNITFRRDPENHRPRINKLDSVKDKEQKSAGQFFYLED